MKTAFFALLVLLPGLAAAQYPTPPGYGYPNGQQSDGRNEAAAACGELTFDSDRAKCIAVVNKGMFFDIAAANACGNLTFGDDAVACMSAITNKAYLPAEVQTCSGMTFSSDAVKCFKNGGKPVQFGPPAYDPRPNVDGYIISALKRIQAELQSGDIAGALVDLATLIAYVDAGMKR